MRELSWLIYNLINLKSVLTSSWILQRFLVFTSRNINSPTEYAHKLHKTHVFSRSVQEYNKHRKGQTKEEHTRTSNNNQKPLNCLYWRQKKIPFHVTLTEADKTLDLLTCLNRQWEFQAVPVHTMKSHAIQKIRCKKTKISREIKYLQLK